MVRWSPSKMPRANRFLPPTHIGLPGRRFTMRLRFLKNKVQMFRVQGIKREPQNQGKENRRMSNVEYRRMVSLRSVFFISFIRGGGLSPATTVLVPFSESAYRIISSSAIPLASSN
jgi:hypothetical protein